MLRPELMWKVDDNLAAARKLPDWVDFHTLCGKRKLCFDNIERDGKRGSYSCTAFTHHPTAHGGWRAETLATGTGKTVIDAMFDAYRGNRIKVPEVEHLIERRLAGHRAAPVPVAVDDDFDALMGDSFEDLMG